MKKLSRVVSALLAFAASSQVYAEPVADIVTNKDGSAIAGAVVKGSEESNVMIGKAGADFFWMVQIQFTLLVMVATTQCRYASNFKV